MTAANVFDILTSGKGHLTYLLHFNGMPWAVADSQHLIDNLTSAQKRLIFNEQFWTDGGSNYIADEMQIYNLLQIPGEQSYKIQQGFGVLTGGTWTARISDRPVVNNWHGQQRTITGLEGLTALADPRQDASIGCAQLYQPFRAGDSELVVTEDVGGLLNTRITAAGPEPYYLWIEGECVGSDGIDSFVDPVLTISVPPGAGAHGSGWRGLLRSKECGHFTNTADSRLIWVTDAPLNGILGRPYTLWVFARLDSSTYTDPFLLRHGKTGLDIKYSSASRTWDVQCLPWIKWLDRDLELPAFQASMRRYTFSHGTPSTLVQEPQLQLIEKVGINWVAIDVWLTATDVTYETLDELYAAVAVALTAASAASGNSYTYICGPGGPTCVTDGPFWILFPELSPRLAGPLPAILQWGDIDASAEVAGKWQQGISDYHLANKPSNEFWWADTTDSVTLSTVKMLLTSQQLDQPRVNPPYILQWFQRDGTCEDTADDTTDMPNHLSRFPITPCGPGNQYRIWIDPEIDASDVEVGDVLQVGHKLTTIENEAAYPHPTQSKCEVGAVGTFAGDPDQSFFDIAVVGGGFSPDAAAVPYIEGVPTDLDPIPPDQTNASYKKYVQGMWLYYVPEVHDADPWAVGLNYTVGPVETLTDILRAILGESMLTCKCPEHAQADDVPDCSSGVSSATWDNQQQTVDWESFELVVATANIPGLVYRIDLAAEFNLWKYIVEELKFYGAIPTLEPDHIKGQMVLRCRRAGLVNGTMATLGGRTLQATNITSEEPADMDTLAEQAESWILNAVDLSVGFDPKQNKFMDNWHFKDASGLAPVGGRTNKVDVKTRISQVNVNEPNAKVMAQNHFIGILNRFARALPIFRCGAGHQTLLTHGLGSDVLCTYNGVHHPYSGAMGITEQPGMIVEWAHDPKTRSLKFAVQVSETRIYGWAPTVCVAATDSTKLDNDNVRIDDIEESGRMFCGQTDTTAGWYDHWFFDCLLYNQSMTGPIPNPGCSCGDYGVVMWELDTNTPTVYTGVVATAVSTGTYAAGGPFMVINDPTAGGAFAAFDNTKRYGITYCDFDHARLQTCQRRWLFEADASLELVDSGAVVEPARRWV